MAPNQFLSCSFTWSLFFHAVRFSHSSDLEVHCLALATASADIADPTELIGPISAPDLFELV